jgi:hypothetical protein
MIGVNKFVLYFALRHSLVVVLCTLMVRGSEEEVLL